MKLLSLDLATRLGWAAGDTVAGKPLSGVKTLPSTGDEIGTFAKAYHLWLIDALEKHEPDFIVMEEPLAHAGGKTNIMTSRKLQGLCWHTEFVAKMKGIPCRQVSIGTWKKAFCGNGGANKKMKPYPVIVACLQRGLGRITDDNEADALGIFTYAASLLDQPNAHRYDPLFSGAA